MTDDPYIGVTLVQHSEGEVALRVFYDGKEMEFPLTKFKLATLALQCTQMLVQLVRQGK